MKIILDSSLSSDIVSLQKVYKGDTRYKGEGNQQSCLLSSCQVHLTYAFCTFCCSFHVKISLFLLDKSQAVQGSCGYNSLFLIFQSNKTNIKIIIFGRINLEHRIPYITSPSNRKRPQRSSFTTRNL